MINIAIDGPSGAGKSYLAKNVAKKLGFIYMDTGALYRTIGLYAKRAGAAIGENEKVREMLGDIDVSMEHIGDAQHVFLNGEDVTGLIREPEISMYASFVSAIPEVRTHLLDLQKSFAKTHNVIMDGRDIGTVILPDAQVKIFLSASDEQRAKRRFLELKEKGVETTVEEVLADMRQRDKNDAERSIAPAVAAEDAVPLDNSEITAEETVEAALKIIFEKVPELAETK